MRQARTFTGVIRIIRNCCEDPGGESNNEAPSNVRYYVENTNTKQRYTNMGVKSLAAAQRMVQNDEEPGPSSTWGSGNINIMAANS